MKFRRNVCVAAFVAAAVAAVLVPIPRRQAMANNPVMGIGIPTNNDEVDNCYFEVLGRSKYPPVITILDTAGQVIGGTITLLDDWMTYDFQNDTGGWYKFHVSICDIYDGMKLDIRVKENVAWGDTYTNRVTMTTHCGPCNNAAKAKVHATNASW